MKKIIENFENPLTVVFLIALGIGFLVGIAFGIKIYFR